MWTIDFCYLRLIFSCILLKKDKKEMKYSEKSEFIRMR